MRNTKPGPAVPIGRCDWGGCDKPGVAWRRAPEGGYYVRAGTWLPVCGDHCLPEDVPHPADCDCTTCRIRMIGSLENHND